MVKFPVAILGPHPNREVKRTVAVTLEEMREAGLLTESLEPHLSDRGRDLLRALESLESQDPADGNEAAADLVLSTNGIFR
jgi:hypothetical protein